MISSNDLHWLAGLLEGEASFHVSHSRSRGARGPKRMLAAPSIALAMNDEDVVRRAHTLMGLTTKITTRVMANARASRPTFLCQTSGRLAIGWMLTLYPLLGERRRAKIRGIVAEWLSTPALPNRGYGAAPPLPPLCGHPERKPCARRMCKSCYCMFVQGRLRLDLHPGLQ